MREKFIRFMQGRYGVDQFSKFTIGTAFVMIVLSVFLRRGAPSVSSVLDFLGMAVIFYTYFRIFSKNIAQRSAENRKYLDRTAKLRYKFNREKSMMEQRKTHHIYSCPGCGQKIRIPKGKGKIEISCPKCNTKFVKRS